ncbi:MAG: arsenosugar biosynthesis radical SAM protein ArsS [Planctomycetes bacterium]|nr:arsenosugar biosynthesis radical SAM protein ArsS [Planctomycetota bacterium]
MGPAGARREGAGRPAAGDAGAACASFEAALAARGLGPLEASGLEVLQVNVGSLCNQACRHCHIDAGPGRDDVMGRETLEACLEAASRAGVRLLELTGGAPELNPSFRWLLVEARRRGLRVAVRSNLTVLLEPGREDLPELFARHGVEVVASLPCYLAENVDRQRGPGVFDRSVEALRRLNALGYGRPGTGLVLTLVHNPLGPGLPPDQASLEAAYRRELEARHGVVFDRLLVLCNMPAGRFRESLEREGRLEGYLESLRSAFNRASVERLMCRTTLSVGWDGSLHDCDFNLALGLGLAPGLPRHIRELDPGPLRRRPIVTAEHCFGCTAGQGSSCRGALV